MLMMSDLMNLLGERIKALRDEKGMSQEELAAAAEVSREYLSALERGRYKMTVSVLVRVARALGTEGWNILQYVERKARR
jgi:transcriptional regulator with XRE-family HTH domain